MSSFPKTTTVVRPQNYITRKSKFYEGNYYSLSMTLDDGTKVFVLIKKQDIENWDDLLCITVDLCEGTGYYDKSTPPKLIHKPWSRYEIVNCITFTQLRSMMSFEIDMELISLEGDLQLVSRGKIDDLKFVISVLKEKRDRILNDSDEIFRSYFVYFNLLERRILFEKRIKDYQSDTNDNNTPIPNYYFEWLERTDLYFNSVNFGSDKGEEINSIGSPFPNPNMNKNYFLNTELLEIGIKIKNEGLVYKSEDEDQEEPNWDDYTEGDVVNDAFEGDWQLYRETMD